ncbi:hypothetical protein [Streptomyces sp. DW26H14]
MDSDKTEALEDAVREYLNDYLDQNEPGDEDTDVMAEGIVLHLKRKGLL